MPDPYAHVQPGDAITFRAPLWNAMIDAAVANQLGSLGGARELTTSRNSAIIRVKNESGIDLPQYAVLGLDEPVFLPSDSEEAFKREVAFRGIKPVLATHAGKFAVLLAPAAADRVVRAVIAGVVQVLVDVTDERHDRCDVANNNSAHLLSGYHGTAQILWKQSDVDGYGGTYGTGEQWALVRVGAGPPGSIVAKTTGTISARSGATYGGGSAKIQGDSGSGYTDDGVTIGVKNTLNKVIATGSYVTCVWANGKWRVVAVGDCGNLS